MRTHANFWWRSPGKGPKTLSLRTRLPAFTITWVSKNKRFRSIWPRLTCSFILSFAVVPTQGSEAPIELLECLPNHEQRLNAAYRSFRRRTRCKCSWRWQITTSVRPRLQLRVS